METAVDRRNLMDDMRVADLPEGTHGDVAVARFEIGKDNLENMLQGMKHGRSTRPGSYTALTRAGRLWMSDTDAERGDHMGAAHQIAGNIWRDGVGHAERVLIGGLGLGCVLRVALLTPGMVHVDVVEIDPDVIALVGPHYLAMAAERGVELEIHEADLMALTWPKGVRWDVAWFDIWPSLCTDDLSEHGTLARRYTRRADWYGSWGHDLLLHHRRQDRNSGWGW